MDFRKNDAIVKRMEFMLNRVQTLKEHDMYFYNQPISEMRGGGRVLVNGREMGMYASYSYLGLIGHPRINKVAKEAVDKYGTGTHGVRTLAGSLPIHEELEETIANFRGAEGAITFSSGYATNLTVISALIGRGDYVISDKLNHASIVDGCLMSGGKFVRFKHNDMEALESRLKELPSDAGKLVVSDSVFSMDGDIIDFPKMVELCRQYQAWLMIDEAHSLGVLGKTGRGIEEHFGMPDVIDIKMGTLSKTIPSVGGYIAGQKDLITFLRHACRAYIFSAALPPAQAAASNEAFKVILDEPWRVQKLNANTNQFINGLKERGFDTRLTETAIVPVLLGDDETAFAMTQHAQRKDVFVLPVVSPAVPQGLARLRATVTAAHEYDEIEYAMNVIEQAGQQLGILDGKAS
jgi:8-amino-7-oxononanoate synthase